MVQIITDSSTLYTNYSNRILGDATGETGPFNTDYRSSWYDDLASFPYPSIPWFRRGGSSSAVSYAGAFYFSDGSGAANSSSYSFRIVLAD